MFRLSHNFKVFDSIIEPISIDVMDYFGISEFSPNMVFHNEPMFQNSNSLISNLQVPVWNNSSETMRVYFSKKGIAEFLESLIMHVAKAFGFVFSCASFDGTGKIGFSLGHSEPCVSSELSESLKVHGAHILATGWSAAALDNANFDSQDLPPCQIVYSLYDERTQSVKRTHRKNWMNSGKLPPDYAEDNPERSRKYTFGTCNDYRSGKVRLITGKSVQPVREEIVCSA